MGPFPNFKRKFDFVLNFVLSKTIKKIFFALNSFCTGTEKLLTEDFFTSATLLNRTVQILLESFRDCSTVTRFHILDVSAKCWFRGRGRWGVSQKRIMTLDVYGSEGPD